MATRNTNTPSDVTPEASPEVFAEEITPSNVEPLTEVPVSHFVELPMFIDDWIRSQQITHPLEALGTFKFAAQQNGWMADTPSGWASKFARWSR